MKSNSKASAMVALLAGLVGPAGFDAVLGPFRRKPREQPIAELPVSRHNVATRKAAAQAKRERRQLRNLRLEANQGIIPPWA